MASIKQLTERKYKITISNGYRNGKKICKSQTIQVPKSVASRSIRQYVMHEAEELERRFKYGFPAEYHLHTLRHFFVSTLLHSGIDKQTVAELAGHGDTGFLERTYCHPEMSRKQEAAASMLTSLRPGSGMIFPLQKVAGK